MPRRPQDQTSPHERRLRTETSRPAALAATISTPQRQGDRASGDDDADARLLPVYCRFRDLVDAGIATNWPQLLRMIDDQGFPTGIWLSANIRGWEVAEVRRWLASRPSARKSLPE